MQYFSPRQVLISLNLSLKIWSLIIALKAYLRRSLFSCCLCWYHNKWKDFFFGELKHRRLFNWNTLQLAACRMHFLCPSLFFSVHMYEYNNTDSILIPLATAAFAPLLPLFGDFCRRLKSDLNCYVSQKFPAWSLLCLWQEFIAPTFIGVATVSGPWICLRNRFPSQKQAVALIDLMYSGDTAAATAVLLFLLPGFNQFFRSRWHKTVKKIALSRPNKPHKTHVMIMHVENKVKH